MKNEKVIERILDFMRNQAFYEAQFKEIDADILRYKARSAKKNRYPGKRPSKNPG